MRRRLIKRKSQARRGKRKGQRFEVEPAYGGDLHLGQEISSSRGLFILIVHLTLPTLLRVVYGTVSCEDALSSVLW